MLTCSVKLAIPSQSRWEFSCLKPLVCSVVSISKDGWRIVMGMVSCGMNLMGRKTKTEKVVVKCSLIRHSFECWTSPFVMLLVETNTQDTWMFSVGKPESAERNKFTDSCVEGSCPNTGENLFLAVVVVLGRWSFWISLFCPTLPATSRVKFFFIPLRVMWDTKLCVCLPKP